MNKAHFLSRLRLLVSHKGVIKYFSNTVWLFSEKLIRMTVGLVIGAWVARYLGPEKFGLLGFSQSFVFLFSAVATLGLDELVVRELVKRNISRDVILGTSFSLKLVGASIALILIGVAINISSNDTYEKILVFTIASSVIFQSFNVIDLYFQSEVLSRFSVQANTVCLLVSSGCKVFLILAEAPLFAFAILVSFDTFVLSLGYVFLYRCQNLDIKKWKFDVIMAKKLLKDCWPLIFSSLSVGLYMRLDQIMLKEMLSSTSVGYYAAAVRLVDALNFIPIGIGSSLYPLIVKSKNIGEEVYYERLQLFFNVMVWSAIILAIPILFLGNIIVEVLYGVEFISTAKILQIYIFNMVFVFLAVASGKWLLTENLTKYHMYFTVLSAIINCVANYTLITKFQEVGAAYATLLTRIISTSFMIILSRRVFFMYFKTIIFWKWKW